jgi:hypothetical protein
VRLPGKVEINYDKKTNGDITLDVDVTSGYGPETITITKAIPGVHVYYAKNHSNELPIMGSGAKVVIFKGKRKFQELIVPNEGDSASIYWHVFDFDGINGKFKIVNKLLKSAPDFADSSNYRWD